MSAGLAFLRKWPHLALVMILSTTMFARQARSDCSLYLSIPHVANNTCVAMQLDWTDSQSNVSYDIYWSPTGFDGSWTLAGHTTGHSAQVSTSDMPKQQNISFRVISSTSCVSTEVAYVPALPTAVNASASTTNGTITVTWSTPSNVTNTNTRALIFIDNSATEYANRSYFDWSYTFPAPDCQSHSYYVQGASGTVDDCRSAKVLAGTMYEAPQMPTIVGPGNNTIVYSPSITFSWQTGSCAATQRLQIYKGSSPVLDAPVTGTSYPWTIPSPGDYQWRMVACNSQGTCAQTGYLNFSYVTLAITSPVGGENWPPGSTQQVTWAGGGTVKIELFADPTAPAGGASLTGPSLVLANSVSSPASVQMPSDIATTRARIQISRLVGNPPTTIYSYSPNPFTIVTPPAAETWLYSAVDGPGHVGRQSDLCWDFASGMVAAYLDSAASDLRISPRASKTQPWVPGIVDADGGSWPSIIAASDGRLHLAYYVDTPGQAKLYYRTKAAGATDWEPRVLIASVGNVRGDCSIALTLSDKPVIAYNTGDPAQDVGVVKMNAGGGWDPQPVVVTGTPNHITVQSGLNDILWLSFIDTSGGTAIHLYFNQGSGWVSYDSHVPYAPGPYQDVSLALTWGWPNNPRIAYAAGSASTGQRLYFQFWKFDGSGDFDAPVTIDDSPGTIAGVDLGVGTQQWDVGIGYVGNGVAKLATGSYSSTQWPNAWSRAVVDATGNVDAQIKFAFNKANNEKWLTYFDRSTQSLRAASPFVDQTPPATTSDVAIIAYTTSPRTVTLRWTAPGDDGTSGTAAQYSIRKLAGTEITEANWASAGEVSGAPAPAVAGTAQTMVVDGLTSGVFWYFALKARDEANNWSGVSNNDCIKFGTPMALCGDGGFSARPAREEVGPPYLLGIAAVRPNPVSHGVADVSFTLAEGDPATLTVFDLAGRRVETHDLRSLGAGPHDLRIGERAKLSAGNYWVRIRQGERAVTRNVVVIP
jgi:hypothetical protein